MKKLLLAAVAVAAFVASASAQEISIGPRLGVNFSKIKATGAGSSNNTYNDHISSRTGYLAGVAFNRNLFDDISMQMEVLYIQQGTRFEGKAAVVNPVTGIISQTEVKTSTAKNYLQVPFMAKYTFGSEKLKFFVNAGPYAAYWLSGKTKHESNGKEETIEHEFDSDDSDGYKDKRLDFGLLGGAGVGYPMGPGTLTLDLRYNYGLSGTNIYQTGQLVDAPNYSNRGFNVSVGYLFTLED